MEDETLTRVRAKTRENRHPGDLLPLLLLIAIAETLVRLETIVVTVEAEVEVGA